MRCHVYRCTRRADTYLYLAERDAFDRLPVELHALAPFVHVLELDLTPSRRLARVDPQVLAANLAHCGFHLQPPPAVAAPAALRDGAG